MGTVGYAKIMMEGEVCRMRIQIREMGQEHLPRKLYFFTRRRELILGVEAYAFEKMTERREYELCFQMQNLTNGQLSLREMEGIWITDQDGMFVGQWKEGEICRERFEVWKEKEAKEGTKYSVDPLTKIQSHRVTGSAIQSEEVREERQLQEEDDMERVREEAVREEADAPQEIGENVQKEEIQEEEQDHRPKGEWEYLWECYEQEEIHVQGHKVEVIHIQLNDIRVLPVRYWTLGRNKFVVHGFCNYRYLLLGRMEIKDQKKWLLGIPGIYQNQEKVMAQMFGFPQFMQKAPATYRTGQEGFWYQFLDLS